VPVVIVVYVGYLILRIGQTIQNLNSLCIHISQS
jgi:hypothetical protein